VYFLRDSSGENVAVFKPSDEEPGTPNNPRGLNSPLVSSPFLYSPLTSINRSVSHPLPTTSSAYKQMSTPLPRSHQPEIINGFAAHGDLEFGSKRVPIAQITDNKSDAVRACVSVAFVVRMSDRVTACCVRVQLLQHACAQ
jgi:hypothetical protein